MLLRFASGRVATSIALRAATAALAIVGCAPGTLITLDGGPPPDGPADLLVLSVVGPSSITLGLGESRVIEVVLHDAGGAPFAGETVTFSLDGTPGDASIDALEGTTDASGTTSVTVVAGAAPSSFRVRVSHPRARLVFVDVAVGTAFGTLRVEPTYSGGRVLSRTIVHVFTDRTCDAALLNPTGGHERALPDRARDVELTALPVGLSYTVLARGESSSGALYAAACVAGVELMADLPTTIALTLEDTALGYDGSYLVQLSLDTSAAVASAGGSGELAAALGGTPGDASRLVSALADVVDALGGSTEAAALRADRAAVELALASDLDARAAAPGAALLLRAEAAESILGTLVLGGGLSIGLTGAPSLRLDAMTVGGPDDSLSLDASVAITGIELTARIDGAMDALAVERLVVDVGLGALWVSVVEARASLGGGTLARALDVGACAALDALCTSRSTLAAACDATCRAAACNAALEATAEALRLEAVALDERRAQIVLGGALAATDLDADAHSDLFAGDVGGTWQSVSGTDTGTVAGACAATLTVP